MSHAIVRQGLQFHVVIQEDYRKSNHLQMSLQSIAFSSVIFKIWGVGLAVVWTYVQPPTHRACAYPIELTSLQLFSFSFITCFILLPFQMVWEQGVVVIVNLTKLSDLGLVSAVLCHF